jgi:hypothetical protein
MILQVKYSHEWTGNPNEDLNQPTTKVAARESANLKKIEIK